jgi:hypothetical protein
MRGIDTLLAAAAGLLAGVRSLGDAAAWIDADSAALALEARRAGAGFTGLAHARAARRAQKEEGGGEG